MSRTSWPRTKASTAPGSHAACFAKIRTNRASVRSRELAAWAASRVLSASASFSRSSAFTRRRASIVSSAMNRLPGGDSATSSGPGRYSSLVQVVERRLQIEESFLCARVVVRVAPRPVPDVETRQTVAIDAQHQALRERIDLADEG